MKTEMFVEIFKKAEKKYSSSSKRLAAEGWLEDWQGLITTIMSAQSRDETTIPIAENLFRRYKTLKELADAKYEEVLGIFKSLNYNRSKARHVIDAGKFMIDNFDGKIPDNIDELLKIPGVGRKTANLIITEVHNKDGICVDTHVHRISNVLGLVKTKTPHQTEEELKKIAPREYWSRINRIFVLWGKEVAGRDKGKLMERIEQNE